MRSGVGDYIKSTASRQAVSDEISGGRPCFMTDYTIGDIGPLVDLFRVVMSETARRTAVVAKSSHVRQQGT